MKVKTVCWPGCFDEVTTACATPDELVGAEVVVLPSANFMSPSSVENVTDSPGTGSPLASLTVPVMTDVDCSSAGMVLGLMPMLTLVASPYCLSNAVADL